MAWKNQGGPWGGGGGNGGSGGGGPWGGRGGSGGGPSMPQPPDLEDLLRRGQDRFRRAMPGGFGGGRVIGFAVLAGIALWFASGFYRVQPGEVGVEVLFGKYMRITTPGLNYWLPRPIGQVITPNVERTNQINIGYRGAADVGGAGGTRDVPQESLMLTADQNIIDIDFVVQWRVKNASDFLFNIRDPEPTVKIVAESAMREIIGQATLEDALTVKRQEVENRTRELLQNILDEYIAGVAIADVKLQKVDPPAQVIDAFNDVQRARQDKDRKQNEALTYVNDILPRAKGEAQRMIQEATAYKERLIREGEGEASRFLSVYNAYLQDKDVTRTRLYLERMQQVLKSSEKVIIDKGNTGVVPYLPLPELRKRDQPASGGEGGVK